MIEHRFRYIYPCLPYLPPGLYGMREYCNRHNCLKNPGQAVSVEDMVAFNFHSGSLISRPGIIPVNDNPVDPSEFDKR